MKLKIDKQIMGCIRGNCALMLYQLFKKLIRKVYYFTCICAFPECMSEHHVCSVPTESSKGS